MRVAISWSGGKDSCLALHECIKNGMTPVVLLFMIDPENNCSRSNGIDTEILKLQAHCLQLPIYFVESSWAQYEENLIDALTEVGRLYQIEKCVFGDIDILDHQLFEKSVCKKANIRAYLPLWGMSRDLIKDKIISSDIKCKLSVVNRSCKIDTLLTNDYDSLDFDNLNHLGVDVCGENGEFHTVVYDAPLFKHAIELSLKSLHVLHSVTLCQFSGRLIAKN